MPHNFKPYLLAKFDWCNNPYEHVVSINMQMEIIRAFGFLKCKLIYGTFKDASLRWYMGVPRLSVTSYQNLVKRLFHQF